jgi:hypothetical protein
MRLHGPSTRARRMRAPVVSVGMGRKLAFRRTLVRSEVFKVNTNVVFQAVLTNAAVVARRP